MKTYRLNFVLAVLITMCAMPAVKAQLATTPCGSTEARKKLIYEHPEALLGEEALDIFTAKFEEAARRRADRNFINDTIIIPMVFHIIHQGGAENISDAQVIDQIRLLNRDYNLENADTSLVIPSFRGIMANLGIQFRLANIDPQGNCTNGIEHIFSDQTSVGNDYSKLNSWPREKYMNIWVVKSMSGGAAGYAYYPGSVSVLYNTPAMDGVIIINGYIGSIGTSTVTTSRALTHELGHCFNLKHCWGDNNDPGGACGDDDVSDTPITKGWLSCPDSNGAKVCNPPIIENYQNYMEYSYCSRMFTQGQKARVLASLHSNIAGRRNLWDSTNLVLTGTNDTFYNECAPIAGIAVTRRYACINNNVTFKDASSNADPAGCTYYWEFPNGTPNITTDKDPIVSFSTSGWQPVIHTVMNAQGSSTVRDTFLVNIGFGQALQQAPAIEDFETPGLFDADWASVNYDENNTSFKQLNNTTAAHSGSGSAMLNNYYSHADGDVDEIVTPGYDMTGLSTAAPSQMTLSFYYALATSNQYTPGITDSIVVQATNNCGSTWGTVYKAGAITNVANAGFLTGNFVPTQIPAYWKQVKVNLPSTWHTANVRFKFQVYSAQKGNNFYIDDINIGSFTTGIEAISVINDVNLFPNPTDGDATIALSLAQSGKVSVNVYDMTGKNVINVFDGTLNDGETQLPITGASALSAGIYIVNVRAGESVIQKKLVVN